MKARIIACCLAALGFFTAFGQAQSPATAPVATSSSALVAPLPAGQRLFTVGHSFHANWLPGFLVDISNGAGIKGHEQIGFSMIGGSRVIQHWDIPDDKNKAKDALRSGKVDVLTISPLTLPDQGITNFVKLALEHNPRIRITLQQSWLPYDRIDMVADPVLKEKVRNLRDWEDPAALADQQKEKVNTAHFNVPTVAQLEKLHAPYFKLMDDCVSKYNQDLGKQVLFEVPVGRAVLALRAKVIAGQAPGVSKQSDLFIDKLGHPQVVIQTLSGYCYYAVIYQRSPIGLPMPKKLAAAKYSSELNRLLQELAWDAVTHHPLSGVSVNAGPGK